MTRCSSESALLGGQHDPSPRPVSPNRTQSMTLPHVSSYPPTAPLMQLQLTFMDKVSPPPLSSVPPTAMTVQPQLPSVVEVPHPQSSPVEQKALHPPVKPPTAFSASSMFLEESQCSSRQTQNFKASSTSVRSTFPNFCGVKGIAFEESEPASLISNPFANQASYTSQTSTVCAPFPAKKISCVFPPPIPAIPSAYLRNKADSIPPIDAVVDGMVEDFNSLSVGSVPGSNNNGIDIEALPRPLDGDVEPNSFTDMYPMNCKLRYLRLTTYAMPNCHDLVSRWHLPLGAVICPLAEAPYDEGPVIALPMTSIIHCEMCRAIVNPYITIMEGGRTWQCNICGSLNDVPENCIACLDTNGKRMDLAERPELINGSVEYVAAQGYLLQPSKPPVYFFLIDVSINANKSGMLGVVADAIRSCLDRLASFPGTQVGFITFDRRIHFYEMTSSLIQPHMWVISDMDDIFVPLPCGLLVNLSESRALVDAFLDCLPSMFKHTLDVESAFGPAVKAANMVMSKVGGKLLIFQNTLPSLGAGRLWLHQDFHHFHVTDKNHVSRLPGDPFYSKMADEFTKHEIVVNVYVFSDNYADIASLGTLSSYTGGQIYYYPNFTSAHHNEKLRYDLIRDLTRETAWDAQMRVRCGRGLRIASIHGNLMFGATDLLSLPALDCDKAYTALLCLEGTLHTPQAYLQVSLAYTSSSGERRIRVHTAALPVVSDLLQMYRHADNGAIISLYSRLAIEKTLSPKLEDAQIVIQQQIVKAIREYQSFFPLQNRQVGKMFYPESLKYLPLYGLSLCKSMPLRWGYSDAHLDDRCAQTNIMMALPVKRLLKLLYPSLFRIDDYLLNATQMVNEFKKTCKRLPLSAESLDSRGLYLYDDGFRFVLYFGRMLLPEIAASLVGEHFATDFPKIGVFKHDNSMTRTLLLILEKLREDNPSDYQLPYLVREVEQPAAHSFFVSSLIEDPVDDAHGYTDWILKLFQHIQ